MIYHAALMGVNFRSSETRELVKGLANESDVQLELEPEPTNQYDPNAVKVMYDVGHGDSGPQLVHLGYVAKEIAEEIAPLLSSEGVDYKCHICGWLGTIKPHLEIEIIL